MTKQELVNEMVSKRNFKKYVEICLKENLEIEKLEFAPDILLYNYEKDKDKIDWYKIDLDSDRKVEFIVDGKKISGVKNFFKFYEKITRFIITVTFDATTYEKEFDVIPQISNKQHWYIDEKTDVDGHFEISYNLHSLSNPAYTKKIDGKLIDETYNINGDIFEYETWLIKTRNHKLKRIMKGKKFQTQINETKNKDDFEWVGNNNWYKFA
jgi:hypothetical protein